MSDVTTNASSEPDPEANRRFRRAINETYDMLEKMGSRDRESLDSFGALGMVHRLLKSSAPSDGFSKLWEMGRLHLSVEAVVLRPEFKALFSDDERKVAADRLSTAGYDGVD